jgi:NAD(P)-dependent dehydrogenase (short-subunit alcohol dehydrogenase family)
MRRPVPCTSETRQLAYVAPRQMLWRCRPCFAGDLPALHARATVTGRPARLGTYRLTSPSTPFASLEGKVALVTGASSGLGAHFARLLSGNGARVALAARRIEPCMSLCRELSEGGGDAVPIVMDVSDAASVERAVREVLRQFGQIDILVNNAGVALTKKFLDLSEKEWDATIDVNLKGGFLVAQAAASSMMNSGGGAIINVASITGLRVAGSISAYASSKAGVIQLTKAMALELARYNIRVNALCPGYIETEINREFFATDAGQALISRIPFKRLGKLEDLDVPLLLLCSDAGRYMTGSTLVVDGGHLQSSL